MRIPFLRRKETRETGGSFTDSVVAAILNMNSATGTYRELIGLEMVAGLFGRAFAAAQVDGDSRNEFTPHILSIIGRTLARHGEAVFLVTPANIVAVSDYSVKGSYNRGTWRYSGSLPGPSGMSSFTDRAENTMLHFRYSADLARPWKGIGPMQTALIGSRFAADVANLLTDELAGPRGRVLPVPNTDASEDAGTDVKTDLESLRGGLAVVESMASDWQSGHDRAPRDWEQKRIGPEIPNVLLEAHEIATKHILAAFGLSPALFVATEGGASREAWRQALYGVIAPLARGVEAEVRSKMNLPDFALSFRRLQASDIAGRARAFGALTKAGMTVEAAAANTELTL